MKITVSRLNEKNDYSLLYEEICKKENESSDFVQTTKHKSLDLFGEGTISVGVALTLYNMGCHLVVSQNRREVLNCSFDCNGLSVFVVRLEHGSKIGIFIDVTDGQ